MPEVLTRDRVKVDDGVKLWLATDGHWTRIAYAGPWEQRNFQNEQIRLWLEKYEAVKKESDMPWNYPEYQNAIAWLSYDWTT